MKYYVGIDGGGTRTAVAVADENQKIVYRCHAKTINFCGVDFNTAKHNMDELFLQLKKAVNVHSFEQVVIGSSSNYDTEELKLLKQLNAGIPSQHIVYHSDADVAMQSIDEDIGAILISGTGSMLLGKVGEKRFTVGGYGHLLGDEGSAYDIAVRGIQQALRYHDGWAEPTVLLEKMKDYFALNSIDDIIYRIYIDGNDKSYIAGFSKTLSQAALDGDNVAYKILTNAAESLIRQYTALHQKCGGVINVVYLYGSVLIKDKIVSTAFKKCMSETHPQITVKNLTRPPEIGALRFCFNDYKEDLK